MESPVDTSSNFDSTTSPLTSLGSVGENYYLCWPIIEHMYQILELFSHSRTRSLASSFFKPFLSSWRRPFCFHPFLFSVPFSVFIHPTVAHRKPYYFPPLFSLVSKVDPVQFNCFFCSIIMILDCHAQLVFAQLSELHWFGILLLARSSLRS